MTDDTVVTIDDNGEFKVEFPYKNETQREIERYEAIVKDLQMKVQMTNQEIKNNKAKIKILKDFLSK